MELFWAGFLGVVQGFTEFLPISSSGHLVIFQKLIPNFSQPGVLFDIILHLGTLFAVIMYFYKRILAYNKAEILVLVIGTFPAVIIGFLFKDMLENTYIIGGLFLGLQFLITALLCYLTDSKKGERTTIIPKDAVAIGIAQAFSILPAVSRSGATIFAGVAVGVDREKAAEYSFLLSIPAILGASLLEIISYRDEIFPLPYSYLVGFIFALLTGLLSIKVTLTMLTKRKFRLFAYYTIAVAFFVFFFVK